MIKLSLQDTATSPMERKKNSSDQKLTHSEQLCQKYEEFLVYLCQMLDLNSIMELQGLVNEWIENKKLEKARQMMG